MLNRSLIAPILAIALSLPFPLMADELVSANFAPISIDIQNPERGLVGWAGDLADPWEDGIRAEANRGYKTQRAHIRLDRFRQTDLPATWLKKLDAGFNIARSAGIKVIPRFVYNSPSPDAVYWLVAKDARLEQVTRHIEQVGKVLRLHDDVIAYIEAGFVGAWGEWHSSSNGLTQPAAKTKIKDALLAHFPENRAVMFRTPRDLRLWYPDPKKAGTSLSRIGFHNDCFLSGTTDANTYQNEADREYARELTRQVPFGGETCSIDSRTACSEILSAGREYHLTWLNRFGHLEAFKSSWRQGGCLAQVQARIGYRFEISGIAHTGTAKVGSPLRFTLGIRNQGWSKLHNPRRLVVHLVSEDENFRVNTTITSVKADQWRPTSTHSEQFEITAPARGTYRVMLSLPDASKRLTDDPRYSIRFANADDRPNGQYWDAKLGAFFTGTRIQVTE